MQIVPRLMSLPADRPTIEAVIEFLIDQLDRMDGDIDLEDGDVDRCSANDDDLTFDPLRWQELPGDIDDAEEDSECEDSLQPLTLNMQEN